MCFFSFLSGAVLSPQPPSNLQIVGMPHATAAQATERVRYRHPSRKQPTRPKAGGRHPKKDSASQPLISRTATIQPASTRNETRKVVSYGNVLSCSEKPHPARALGKKGTRGGAVTTKLSTQNPDRRGQTDKTDDKKRQARSSSHPSPRPSPLESLVSFPPHRSAHSAGVLQCSLGLLLRSKKTARQTSEARQGTRHARRGRP